MGNWRDTLPITHSRNKLVKAGVRSCHRTTTDMFFLKITHSYLGPVGLRIRKAGLAGMLILGLVGCSKHTYREVYETTQMIRQKNTVFLSAEKVGLENKNFFNQKYSLDSVLGGETDEFRRILILRNWISRSIRISDFEGQYPGEGYADKILDLALRGQGYHCEHYMTVQNAIMNSFGYVTRCLGVGQGVPGGPDGHHGTNEIWSNTYQKWVMSDAKYDHHFEKNGVPLSALEIREEYLKNRAADIRMVRGVDRKVTESIRMLNKKGEEYDRSKDSFAQSYTWLSWERSNNRFSQWPSCKNEVSHGNYFLDSYSRNNTWIRDGRRHWAYDTPYMHWVSEKTAIEWTPNLISSSVRIKGAIAEIKLESDTPNFLYYEMKTKNGKWLRVTDQVRVKCRGEKTELKFRSVNVLGVYGPEHRIVLVRGTHTT